MALCLVWLLAQVHIGCVELAVSRLVGLPRNVATLLIRAEGQSTLGKGLPPIAVNLSLRWAQ